MLQPRRHSLQTLLVTILLSTFPQSTLTQDAFDTRQISQSFSQQSSSPTTTPINLDQPPPPPANNDPGTGDDGHRDGLLNYYFLIIAVFVILLCLVYWTLTRRRRHLQRQSQSHQTHALNQDLSSPTSPHHQQHPYHYGHRGGVGRWRRWRPGGGSRDTTYGTSSEGLNERGEAPPPYVKEPDRAYLGSRGTESTQDIELGDWQRPPPEGGRLKPPDYS